MMRINKNTLSLAIALCAPVASGVANAQGQAKPESSQASLQSTINGQNHIAGLPIDIVSSPGQGALTIEQAMELAEKHSFARQAAGEDQEASRARQSQIKGGMGPRLTIEAARGGIDMNVNKLAGVTLPTGQRYPNQISSLGIVINQPITGLVTANRRLEAEEKTEAAYRSQVATETNDAKLRGAEAYINALKARLFLGINMESDSVISRQMTDAESLRKSGRISDLDYSRFQLASSEAKSAVVDAQAQMKVAADTLREVLGLAGTDDLKLVQLGDLGILPVVDKIERNELQSSEKRVEALEATKRAARGDYYPQVNAYVRASRDYAAKDVSVNFAGLDFTLHKEDFRDNLSYGFNLTWDIWDWGVRSARQSELSAQVAHARTEHDALASRLRVETSQANAEYERAVQNLKNAQIAEKLSADILRSFEIKFRNGLSTTTDLLSIQRDRTRAQGQLANAIYDVQGAALRKRRAEGGTL